MRKGLDSSAYEPVPEGKRYEPYVSASESLSEFTLKAVIPGAMFGILFGAANAYLGLLSGLTISTSIPVAVMTVAAFRALRGVGIKSSLLEANLAQTVGSASSSVASGVIFTLPALFMWGFEPKLMQMTTLALCGGLLGILFMVPLRRFLIEGEHGKLPYPEGTACAEVLVASEVGGAKAKNVFLGLFTGGLFRFLFGWLKPFPNEVDVHVPLIPKGRIGADMSSALFGVGFILGPRIGSVMVAGGVLSSLIIIPAIALWGQGREEPYFPETVKLIRDMKVGEIWSRYVRYIGAGAVATAGLITLIRSIPTMVESFKIGVRQLGARVGDAEAEPRTGRDLSLKIVAGGVFALILAMAFIPQAFGVIDATGTRLAAALCVAVFAFFFVTVASRIVGLVGVTSNPTSGMTIAALLGTSAIFLLFGWTDLTGKIAALTVGCVVAIAASIAGDTSQDLKTGFILGATPWKQQTGELIGVLTSAVFVCATVLLLVESFPLGSEELPAPQATLMKLVIDGVLEQKLPWALVGIGVGLALLAEIVRVPSLPFAVGVYLPVSTMVPVFLGGMLRWWLERRSRSGDERAERRERGVLFGSGLVGGEGLMGVLIAGVVYLQIRAAEGKKKEIPLPGEIGQDWASPESVLPMALAAVAFVGLIWFFARRART